MNLAQASDVAGLRAAVQAGATPQYRFFWGHRPRADGCLSDACFSQWWPANFTVESVTYSSAEQFMMAEKARVFGDLKQRLEILSASNPDQIKRLGRGVACFDQAEWAKVRFEVVVAASLHKFGQNTDLRAHLLATADAVIVEASPLDEVWGIGLAASDASARDPLAWRGENLLGFALMRAREQLRAAGNV